MGQLLTISPADVFRKSRLRMMAFPRDKGGPSKFVSGTAIAKDVPKFL